MKWKSQYALRTHYFLAYLILPYFSNDIFHTHHYLCPFVNENVLHGTYIVTNVGVPWKVNDQKPVCRTQLKWAN